MSVMFNDNEGALLVSTRPVRDVMTDAISSSSMFHVDLILATVSRNGEDVGEDKDYSGWRIKSLMAWSLPRMHHTPTLRETTVPCPWRLQTHHHRHHHHHHHQLRSVIPGQLHLRDMQSAAEHAKVILRTARESQRCITVSSFGRWRRGRKPSWPQPKHGITELKKQEKFCIDFISSLMQTHSSRRTLTRWSPDSASCNFLACSKNSSVEMGRDARR